MKQVKQRIYAKQKREATLFLNMSSEAKKRYEESGYYALDIFLLGLDSLKMAESVKHWQKALTAMADENSRLRKQNAEILQSFGESEFLARKD